MKTSLKNFTKVLLGVAVLGGAALTQSFTKSLTPPSGDYVLIDGTWEPKSNHPLGECLDVPSETCSYDKIGSAPGSMNDEFRNPANFQSVDQGQFDPNE
ncbi:hypothetical protein HCX49_05925 [Sphingobacterium kitahiroshimense]|uniref:hypothetical protein n=1 Tax=Sphingobacterium sp. B16(2022) TaxID=2914044 RepID=UPI00143CBC9E|nr:hypothetical protein [Sphingobacterium sp. B16(2022)]NJI72736.1 hypothetical protein [Sphingobacterium sp. B16(2022)]